MTMLQHIYKIEDDSKKDSLLGIIADKNCRIILDNIKNKKKSVMEIAKDTGICISTIYRKIQVLEDNKLLRISGSFSEDGQKSFFYKNRIKSIHVMYNEGITKVEIIYN